jgi:hypothetical protein
MLLLRGCYGSSLSLGMLLRCQRRVLMVRCRLVLLLLLLRMMLWLMVLLLLLLM